MDKRTRVLHAFRSQPVDRPPVGFWFHFPEEAARGQASIDAHLGYYNQIDVDMVKIMCDGFFYYPLPETLKTPADWDTLEPLDRDHPFIQEQVERARSVRDGVKQDICMFYNVFAPFSSIRFGTSDEFVMRSLQENPEGVQHALHAIAQTNALLSELLITEGSMDGIYYCVQGGEFDRFTPEEYRKWITPSDRFVLEHANRFSLYNILHCCGWAGIRNNLEIWQDYPAAVFNWAVFIEGMSLNEGRRFFGKPVLGGFDNRKTGLLYNGTREEIAAFTRKLVEETGSTGLIIGADCTLPGDVQRERIEWVVDAAKELAEN